MLASLKLHLLGQKPVLAEMENLHLGSTIHPQTQNTVFSSTQAPAPTQTSDSAPTFYGVSSHDARQAAAQEIQKAVATTLLLRGRPTQKAPTLRLAVDALRNQ